MIANKKVLWLLLLIISLLAYLGSPAMLLAQEAKIDLSLRILPEYFFKEVIPGEDNILFIEVRNNGDGEITNIRFKSNKPENWVVDFEPSSIEYLGAGSSHTVDVKVTPGHDTSRGGYDLTFIAEANETRAATSTIMNVENGSSLWLWVGLGVAALVIAGFVIIFLRFGR